MKFLITTIATGIIMLSIITCNTSDKNREYKVFHKDGFLVKGYVINDSIFDDTVYYYNPEGKLAIKEVYKNGKLDGISEHFYSNGVKKTSTGYFMGLKHGENQYFDSLGRCTYSDTYYYSMAVGPVVYYDTLCIAKRFFFTSFDNRTLWDVDYSLWKGFTDEAILKFINYSYELRQIDSVRESLLFLYLIQPPRFFTKYSLFKRSRRNDKEQLLVAELSGKELFKEVPLPLLESEYYYSIQLYIYDSLIKKQLVVNREIW